MASKDGCFADPNLPVDPFASVAVQLSLCAQLLGLCGRSHPHAWLARPRAQRTAPLPLPSLGRPRLRPGAAGPRAASAGEDWIERVDDDGAEESDLGDRTFRGRPLRLAMADCSVL